MQIINSKHNEFIKFVKKLHYKKYRQAHQLFILEGVLNFKELEHQISLVDTIIFSETENMEMYEEFCETYPHIRSVVVTPTLMKSISQHKTTPGIMALVKLPKYDVSQLMNDHSFFIYLDQIRDPGNLGAIVRSAWALGADGLLLNEGCVDPFSGKTARASMGGILNLPIITDFTPANLQKLKQQGYQIVVTSIAEDSQEYHAVSYKDKIVLVIGNEVTGVGSEVMNLADEKVYIRMYNQADSLNAASACAIIAAEVSHKRHGENVW